MARSEGLGHSTQSHHAPSLRGLSSELFRERPARSAAAGCTSSSIQVLSGFDFVFYVLFVFKELMARSEGLEPSTLRSEV